MKPQRCHRFYSAGFPPVDNQCDYIAATCGKAF